MSIVLCCLYRCLSHLKQRNVAARLWYIHIDEASGGPLSNNVALGGSIAAPSQPVQPHDQVLGEERAAEEESHGGQKRALTPVLCSGFISLALLVFFFFFLISLQPVLPLPKINKPVDPTAGAEVLTDAGRKREVPVNTQVKQAVLG